MKKYQQKFLRDCVCAFPLTKTLFEFVLILWETYWVLNIANKRLPLTAALYSVSMLQWAYSMQLNI